MHRWALALIASAACITALTLSATTFAGFSVNNDEPVYVFQSDLLANGHLTLPAGHDSGFFRPWMSGRVGDRLVMVFPPPFPAVLALCRLATGTPRTALGLLAAFGVVAAYVLTRELCDDRRAGLWAAALLAFTPLFVIQSALFLSYVLALDLELAAAALVVVGLKRERRRALLGAGGCLGLLFFARPLDAMLFAVPLTAVAVLRHHRALNRRVRAAALVVGGLPFVVLSLAYNAALSGDPLRLPLDAIGGDNRPGFGTRQLSAGTPAVRYTAQRAVNATWKNLAALPGWLPGGVLAIALACLGLWHLRRSAWSWALASTAVLFPAGYLFYWGTLLIVAGRRSIGPHYYLAMLIPVVVLAGAALQRLWSWRRPVAAVLACLIAAGSVIAVSERVEVNERQVALHAQERALLARANLDNAIVILPAEQPDGAWIGHPRPSFLNDPDLSASVLFAADHGGDNFRLLDNFPGRRLYRQFSRTGSGRSPTPTLWSLSTLSAETFEVNQRVENTDGSPIVTVDVTDARGRVSYLLDAHSAKGRRYELTWSVSPKGPTLLAPAAVPLRSRLVPNPGSSGQLTFGAAFGMSTDRDNQSRVEERYWYRVRDGVVSVMLPGEQWQHAVGLRHRWTDRDVASYHVTLQPV